MPSTGFYLFLRQSHLIVGKTRFYVSMPSTGFYLFLLSFYRIHQKNSASVNALNGLLLISSVVIENNNFSINVSMPSTGFYLFLHRWKPSLNFWKKSVNALNGLLLISSRSRIEKILRKLICVNALNGLLLISSVPSQNP